MKYELPSTELIVIEENNYLKFGEYLNDMQCDDTTNKLCLDDLEYVKKLQQENRKQKEIIDKAIDFIKNGDLLYLANKNSIVYRNNIEIRAVADRLNDLLQILEDKEVISTDNELYGTDLLDKIQELENGDSNVKN